MSVSEYKLDTYFSNHFVDGTEENLTVYVNRSVCFVGSAEKSNWSKVKQVFHSLY